MLQEKADFQLMLTELNAFGVPFLLPPPLLQSVLTTRTWDGGDPKQKSLFTESPFPPPKTSHSSEPDMKFVKVYFFANTGTPGCQSLLQEALFLGKIQEQGSPQEAGKMWI